MLTGEELIVSLRDALNHLHEPDRLRKNPLAELLGVAGRFNTPFLVQDALLAAIEALRPGPDARPSSPAHRAYDLLLYRYVQQLDQQEVADQLGVSIRQFARAQNTALELLAAELFRRLPPLTPPQAQPPVATQPPAQAGVAPAPRPELLWLKGSLSDEAVDLAEVLAGVITLLQNIAGQHETQVVVDLGSLPGLAVHPVALRQMLINLLGVAIARSPHGTVRVWARPEGYETEIRIEGGGPVSAGPETESEARNLAIAGELAGLCDGNLALVDRASGFTARLSLPASAQVPVLVIDDNADALQLFRRYASGSRYRVTGLHDPEAALAFAAQERPQMILLDVMMPQIDGWEVLGRLRQHPATARIPVVICTILAQEELALSLGASAFVPKPVTREAFLAALDAQFARQEAGPR